MKFYRFVLIIVLFSFSFSALAEPTLWKIQSDKADIYLFGSIHVGKKEMYPFSKKINNAFNQSQHLVLEIDLLNPKMLVAVASMYLNGILPDKQTLESVMTKSDLLKLQAALKGFKIPYSSVANLKPWLIGMNLQMLMFTSKDYKPELGVDIHFAQRALRNKKQVIELESASEQFSYFDDLTMEQQVSFLLGSLEQVSSGQEMITKMVALWQQGQQKEFADLILSDLTSSEENRFFYDIFLKNRNIKMADKIAGFVETGKSYFVVVGAAHYLGEDSIIEYLKKKGLEVKQVN